MTAPSDAPVPVRLDTVVLDCPDPPALARFYAALLGRQVDPGGDADWQSLAGDGSGWRWRSSGRRGTSRRPGPTASPSSCTST